MPSRQPRADATRNRRAVLLAAEGLFENTLDHRAITIAAVAERAGVGKATVIRAFGDRAGLLRALVSHRGIAWPPPLGDRIDDYTAEEPRTEVSRIIRDLTAFKLANRSLWLALEASGPEAAGPYRSISYDACHAALVQALQAIPGIAVPDFTAHALLAAVRSDLIEHVLERGYDQDDVHRAVAQLVLSILGGSHDPSTPPVPVDPG